jgi:hypothetical protein
VIVFGHTLTLLNAALLGGALRAVRHATADALSKRPSKCSFA